MELVESYLEEVQTYVCMVTSNTQQGDLSVRGLFFEIFINEYPTQVRIPPFTPHQLILYPVLFSQLLAHNMDAMKHCLNLSYFANWGSSFPASVNFLQYFHLKDHVQILWESTIVTRDPTLYSVLEMEEGGQKRINHQ